MAVDRFPVEATHIMMFARSVADDNQIYHDENYAKGTEVGHIIAPPTFAQSTHPAKVQDRIADRPQPK